MGAMEVAEGLEGVGAGDVGVEDEERFICNGSEGMRNEKGEWTILGEDVLCQFQWTGRAERFLLEREVDLQSGSVERSGKGK